MSPKSVLITGCSAGGIGAALAVALVERGHHVFATARATSKIPEELADSSNVTVLPLDVLSAESVARAAEAVARTGRGLDVLVNNAGAGYAQPVLDMDIARAQRLYDVNVWGPVRTVQGFADLLIVSRGRVVNMSTVGAIVNTPWISAYTSSKAALTCISDTLRLELSPFGVGVVTVMAGVVESHFHDNDSEFKLPRGSRYAHVEEIISTWASGAAKPKGCSAEQFAESLVGDVVGEGAGGLVFRGPHSAALKFATKWLPTFVVDYFMSVNQGLKELSQHVAQVRKSD